MKAITATIIVCLCLLVACASIDNGGDKDWVEVQITTDGAHLPQAGYQSLSPDGTLTALITVIPATDSVVDAFADLSDYYDRQLQNLSDSTVTLTVPLNESLQLVKKTFSDPLTLEQAVAAESFTAIGASEAFTVDPHETSKTVTISLTVITTDTTTDITTDTTSDEPNSVLFTVTDDPVQAPDGTLTVLISVIPATDSTMDASTDLSNYHDRQLQDLTTDTVTLLVPANESIQLVKKTFSDTLTLEQAVTDETFTAIGASEAFTLDGSETAKSVTISLTLTATGELSGVWSFVDGNGTTGINKDGTRSARGPMLAVYDSTLNGGAPAPTIFTAWSEASASTPLNGYGQIRVAGWDGNSTWTFIDGDGADGLNMEVTQLAEHLNIAVFDSKLYLAFSEYYSGNSTRQVRIKAWDDVTWEWRDGGDPTGLNKNSENTARTPRMAEFNSNLFVAWEEDNGVGQIRVRMWDGSSWGFVDGDGINGINRNFAQEAENPHLIAFNSKLYALWDEEATTTGNPKQIRIAEWDGTSSWIFKESDTNVGLNYDTARSANGPIPIVHNSKVYITWAEVNPSAIGQVRVIEWDGASTWRFIDGDGVNGLNRNVAKEAGASSLFEFNSKLHVAWSELDENSIYQLRVAQWDGSSTWNFVDGDGDVGINKNSSDFAAYPSAVTYNSKLYLGFMEGGNFAGLTTKTDQIRIVEAQTD